MQRSKDKRRKILILGGGVSGTETARVAAGRGHQVEIWEKTSRVGGQIHLATVAPDKQEVAGVWSYPFAEVMAMNVPFRTGVDATVAEIKLFNPDMVVLATGAAPRPAPFDLAKIGSLIKVFQAWDVLANPECVNKGVNVTIVGGGTVGLETADLLVKRGCSVTLIEPRGGLAEGMSKSNRMEVIDRLRAANVTIRLKMTVVCAKGETLTLRGEDGTEQTHAAGDCLIIAVGAQPNLAMVPVLEEAGVPYVAVGDCYQPGDFMSCLRDARMIGTGIDNHALRTVRHKAGMARLS